MFQELAIARRRSSEDFERDVSLAWHIAAFQRQEKLPDLKKVLERIETRAKTSDRQTPQQHLAMMYAAAELFGGQVRPVNKKRKVIRRG